MLRHQACIVLVAGLVFFAGLGRPRLWDDDETKNARCAQEMLARGDWIVPTFNFRLRPDKPALFDWLAMVSYELFGVNEFAARFPSALLALGTSLITYHLGRRLFRPEVGLWAGLAMASNVMFAMIGRAATPDSILIFCTTAAFAAYVFGTRQTAWTSGPRDQSTNAAIQSLVPRRWWCFAVMYAAMALAVLAKGPIGVVLPLAALGGFVVLEGSRWRCVAGSVASPASPARPEIETLGSQLAYLRRWIFWRLRCVGRNAPAAALALRPFTLLAAMLVIAAPWYAIVALRTHGQWWQEFFWDHNVQRFLESREGHHGLLLFPPLALMACFFPWSLFLPIALADAIRRIRYDGSEARGCRLLICWSAVWIVFFSICGTKQPNYILPAYPALAVLVGLWIADWIAAPARILGRRFLPAIWATVGAAGIGLTIAMLVAAHWFPEMASFAWTGLILVTGATFAWRFARRRSPKLAMASIVASAALLLPALLGGAAVPLSREQNGVRLGEAVAEMHEPPTRLGQFRLAFVGLVYYADRKVEELSTPRAAAAMLANGEHPVVVTDPQGFEQLSALMPGKLRVVGREPRFCRPGEMVLVARIPSATIADKNSPTHWQ